MALLVTDPGLESRLLAERKLANGDRFDEVWERLYVMAPLANDEHQDIQLSFGAALKDALGWGSGASVRAGVNVSDRDKDWINNYRCPDVVVFLPGNPAINHGLHWQGGPDFMVEIVSEGDRSREKLPFYASVGVREVLIVDRNPWAMELYAATGSVTEMQLVAAATSDGKASLHSGVLPISFELLPGSPRPRIRATLTGKAPADPSRLRNSWLI